MLANEYNIELKSFFNGGKKGNLGFEPRTSSSIEHSLYEKHGALQFPSPMMKIDYLPKLLLWKTRCFPVALTHDEDTLSPKYLPLHY